MAADKLSAREAALIAQARAELGKTAAAPAPEQRSAPGTVERAAPAAAIPAPAADLEQRIAALMAAARAESERLRQRQRRLYVWVPIAFVSIVGLCALLWIWHSL